MGCAAASTLPAVEQALKMHRVSYTAHEAIHKIRGEPVPVWYRVTSDRRACMAIPSVSFRLPTPGAASCCPKEPA